MNKNILFLHNAENYILLQKNFQINRKNLVSKLKDNLNSRTKLQIYIKLKLCNIL